MLHHSKYKRKILLADDHAIIRRGLKVLIDNHFGRSEWYEIDRVSDIITYTERFSLTHLVLDMQLLDANIIDVIPHIRKTFPAIPILVYTMNTEEIYGPKLKKLGVNVFVSKQEGEGEVIKAFDHFFKDKPYVKEIIDSSKSSTDNPLMHLSERELSVLDYLLMGKSVKEISETMQLKATTIATYKARIFDKLEVTNLIELRTIADLYK